MFVQMIFSILLLITIYKIACKVLQNISNDILHTMLLNKLYDGIIVSRKHFSFLITAPKVKNHFFYYLIQRSILPPGTIPYRFIYDDQQALQMKDFLNWGKDYLESQGYHDFKEKPGHISYCKYFLCHRKQMTYLVACGLLQRKEGDTSKAMNEDAWQEVSKTDMQLFAAEMLENKVTQGIFMTNGGISTPAAEFAHSLSEEYTIITMDGIQLIESIRESRSQTGTLVKGA